jgi:hypothetical protein
MKSQNYLILLLFFYSFSVLSQNYDSNFFPLGVWSIRGDFRPVNDFLYDVNTAANYHHTSFQNLKAQGFNAAFLSYEPIGYTIDTILDIAEINDIRVIPAMNNLNNIIKNSLSDPPTNAEIIQAIENDSINRIKQSPQILGYYLYDEPLPGWIDFNVLENAKNLLESMTVDAPHPILSTWNDEQVMSYIDGYIDLDVLMMDAYPLEDGDAIGDLSDYMPSYFAGADPPPFSDYINTVRENHCEVQNRPMWVVLQAFGDIETPENGGYWRQVYPKEIRLQVALAIMQGAKGIWYFVYESEYPYLLGLLDISGQSTQRLDEVIAINNQISQISDTLLKLRVVADQSSINVDQGAVKLHVDPVSGNQDKYVIGVNTDVFSVSHPTINIEKSAIGYDVLSIVDMNTNESIPYTETANTISFSLNIPIADVRLIKISNQNLATHSLDNHTKVSLFPNPVKQFLHIDSNTVFKHYTIYNFIGNKIIQASLNNEKTIDLSKLKSGIYFVELTTDKYSFKHKFIKE